MTDAERQELRRVLAVGVMGWHRGFASSLPNWPEQWLDANNKPTRFTVHHKSKDEQVFKPDTSPDQCFQFLIPRMQELGFDFEMTLYADNLQNEVILHGIEDGAIVRVASFPADKLAETVALACQKALSI